MQITNEPQETPEERAARHRQIYGGTITKLTVELEPPDRPGTIIKKEFAGRWDIDSEWFDVFEMEPC